MAVFAPQAAAQTLTVKTTSTDTSKQCIVGDETKTKTGETDLTLHLNYQLTKDFATANGQITVDLPMRYQDFFEGNSGLGTENLIASSTYESMVDSSLLSFKLVHSGTTYWPTDITLTENQSTSSVTSNKDTKILATFASTPAATISSGQSIDIYITGVKNPASTLTQTNFKITVFNSQAGTTENQTTVSGLETCVKDSVEGSASAIIGYDRIDTTGAKYRFKFKSQNVYPAKAGFKVTLPSDLINTNMADYSLTCNAGCTASSSVIPTNSPTTELFFEDVFTAEVDTGTLVDLTITGWTNPSTETALAVTFEVLWHTSNDYQIDKFENLASLSSTQSIYSGVTSSFANTVILITSQSARGNFDCRIRVPERVISAQAVGSSGAIEVETASLKFEAVGDSCEGRDSFQITAYARQSDGTRLNSRYTFASINYNGLIQVLLTPSQDTSGSAVSHAVYVQVSDYANADSTNIFCFMVTDTAGEDFCRTLCQEQQLTFASAERVEYLEYFIKSVAPSETVKYSDEFTVVSQNPVMCPVLYAGGTSSFNTHGQSTQAVRNYDSSTGSFLVQTDTAGMALTTTQGLETYSFVAMTDAYSRAMPFTIYFEGCSDAYIYPLTNFKIRSMLTNGATETYSDLADIGFASSDEVKCPLASSFTAVSVTYCTDSSSGCSTGSQLLNYYWSTSSNSLVTERTDDVNIDPCIDTSTTCTVLAPETGSEQTIYVTLVYDTDLTVTNKITLEIYDCRSSWNCASCALADLSFDSDVSSANQSLITATTSGCTSCNTGSFLSYMLDSTDNKYYRQCKSTPTSDLPGQACDLGLFYDSSGTCNQACSSLVKGCLLCSSSSKCDFCEQEGDSLYTASQFIDRFGNNFSACTTDLCVGCAAGCSATNCAVCSNFESATTCKVCNSGYYLDSSGTCTLIDTSSTVTRTYYVKNIATAGTVDFSSQLSTMKSNDGLSSSNAFQFLQEVFYTVYSDSTLLANTKNEITVEMEDGTEHYFFSCHNDLYADYEYSDAASQYTDLCAELPRLQQLSPPADNFHFTIKAQTSSATINVLDSYANFNVTGSMTFENIVFRGENALAVVADATATPAHPPLATLPVKKCSIPTEPDGTHTAITFSFDASAPAALSGGYVCSDSGFQSASVPMTDSEECDEESTVIESVRSCPGDPYHEDFFVFDSVTAVPYKRHRVLFNLYNWDRQRSYTPDSRASLTLTNCQFYYFLADYESLINVETNNMVIVQPAAEGASPYIEELGDNRGAIIDIASSKFYHSRFCKGMITYKKRPILEPQYDVLVYGLSSTNSIELPQIDDSLITIQSSHFENLNYGRVIKTLSLLTNATLPISELTSVDYPVFDNHGAVLNLQGFPGGIRVDDSKFIRNMAFIPDIYPSRRSSSDEAEFFANYKNPVTGQLMTTRCDSSAKKKRFFSNYLTSLHEQASHELSVLEKHSPVFISYHENPIVFKNNLFDQNVGLFGGAITIDSPNYVSGNFGDSPGYNILYRPYVLIQNNVFSSNQAYLSGNAIYVRSTRQENVDFETMQACGVGVEFKSNTFTENVAVIHASHGGAVSLECEFVSTTASAHTGASNQIFSDWQESKLIYDPKNVQAGATSTSYHEIQWYTTSFIDNIFIGNAVGQKGSAIYSRQVTFLIVKDNTFTANIPMYSSNYQATSLPYYRYLAKEARQLLFHETEYLTVHDELDYLEKIATDYASGGLIDMPQLQGLIYTESCRTCLVDHETLVEGRGKDCKFCHLLTSVVKIDSNKFIDNQDGVTFFEEHSLERASHFFLNGGGLYNITGNEFQLSNSMFDTVAPAKIPSYATRLPGNYFQSLHSPLFRIKVPREVDLLQDELLSTSDTNLLALYEDISNFAVANVTIYGNFFDTQVTVQPFVEALSFKGSLVHLESGSVNCRVNFTMNGVYDSMTLGTNASLIYVEGASLYADQNEFKRIGYLSITKQNFIQADAQLRQATYFPLDLALWADRQWYQKRGVFWLTSIRSEQLTNSLTPLKHLVSSNVVEFAFCSQGCFMTQETPELAHPTYTEFKNNSYSNIFAERGGVLFAKVARQSNLNNYAVYNATGETISHVQNGAYLIQGYNHETVLIMERITAVDIFGSELYGSLVDISKGALLVCKSCQVTQTIESSAKLTTIEALFNAQNYKFKSRDKNTFYEYLEQTTAENNFLSASNQKGIVVLDSMQASEMPQLDEILVDGESLGMRMNSTYNEDPFVFEGYEKVDGVYLPINVANTQQLNWAEGIVDFLPYSLLADCTFADQVVGQGVIVTNDAWLEMRRTVMSGNTATAQDSSILLASNSTLKLIEQVNFKDNIAGTGAVRLNQWSTFVADGSVFERNTAANKGGAIFALEGSQITLDRCLFRSNSAEISATLVVENCPQRTSIVRNSTFIENSSKQALVYLSQVSMQTSNCTFTDNVSQLQTHGFSLSKASLHISESKVRAKTLLAHSSALPKRQLSHETQTNGGSANKTSGDDQGKAQAEEGQKAEIVAIESNFRSAAETAQNQVTSGFFFVTEESELTMVGLDVSDTVGAVASVVYANLQSRVTIEDCSLHDLVASDDCKFENSGVVVSEFGKLLNINNSNFSANDCSQVRSDRTQVQITNSDFSGGLRQSYLSVTGAPVTIKGSTVRDSSKELVTLGRGLSCVGCYDVLISESTFTDLHGYLGGAIYFKDSSVVRIQDSGISANKAMQGGGIYILNTDLELSRNTFESNFADNLQIGASETRNQMSHVSDLGAGGALFFTCVDQGDSALEYIQTQCVDNTAECQQKAIEDLQMIDIKVSESDALGVNCRLELDAEPNLNSFIDNKSVTGSGNNIFFTQKQVDKSDDDQACNEGNCGTLPDSVEIQIKPLDEKFDKVIVDETVEGLQVATNSRVSKIRKRVFFSSGSFFNMTISVKDKEGNSYTSLSGARAEIQFLNEAVGDECSGCLVPATGSNFIFENMQVIQRPGTTTYMMVKFYDLLFDSESYEAPILIFQSKNCQQGEYFSSESKCVPCEAGSYTFIPQTSISAGCPARPLNSVSDGDGNLYPKKGHVRMHKDSQIFIACFNSNACLEGDEQHELQKCAEGYEGVMCSQCTQGWWKPKNTWECIQCSSTGNSQLSRNIAILCGFLVVSLIMLKQFLNNFKNSQQEGLAIFRIITNTNHFLYILNALQDSQYPLKPYNFLKHFVDFIAVFFNPLSSIVAEDCVQYYKPDEIKQHFFRQVLTMVALPIGILILNLVVWTVGTIFTKLCNGSPSPMAIDKQKLLNRMSIVVGMWLFLVYPSICEILLQSVNCFKSIQEVGPFDTPVTRLRIIPQIECDDAEYLQYKYFCFIPCILLYVIIIPALALYYMAKKDGAIYRSSESWTKIKQNNRPSMLEIKKIKSMYGFFYSGLKLGQVNSESGLGGGGADGSGTSGDEKAPSCKKFIMKLVSPISGRGVEIKMKKGPSTISVQSWYYWEFLIYIEKIIMLAMVTFMGSTNEGIQICIVFLALSFCQVLHIRNLPYYSQTLNTLQGLSLLLCSMFYAARLMIRTFRLNVELPDASTVTGTMSSSIIAEELVNVRRIETANSSDIEIYFVCLAWICLYFLVSFCFLRAIYIHMMLFLLKANALPILNFFTCCNQKYRQFLENYQQQNQEENHFDDHLSKNQREIAEKGMIEESRNRQQQKRGLEFENHTQNNDVESQEESSHQENNPADQTGKSNLSQFTNVDIQRRSMSKSIVVGKSHADAPEFGQNDQMQIQKNQEQQPQLIDVSNGVVMRDDDGVVYAEEGPGRRDIANRPEGPANAINNVFDRDDNQQLHTAGNQSSRSIASSKRRRSNKIFNFEPHVVGQDSDIDILQDSSNPHDNNQANYDDDDDFDRISEKKSPKNPKRKKKTEMENANAANYLQSQPSSSRSHGNGVEEESKRRQRRKSNDRRVKDSARSGHAAKQSRSPEKRPGRKDKKRRMSVHRQSDRSQDAPSSSPEPVPSTRYRPNFSHKKQDSRSNLRAKDRSESPRKSARNDREEQSSKRKKQQHKVDPRGVSSKQDVESLRTQAVGNRARSGGTRGENGNSGEPVEQSRRRVGKGLNIFKKNKREKSNTASNKMEER